MIRLFINGLAASAGGGLTYLRNVVPQLSRRPDVEATVLVTPGLQRELAGLPGVTLLDVEEPSCALIRFGREQVLLPKRIRSSGAQALLSAGNFALWNSPVPQILLSRNSLYTSADFVRDVRSRGDYRLLVDTAVKGWLARRSIRRAEVTVAPSVAFAEELSRWSGTHVLAVHHGFDPVGFTADPSPLPALVEEHLQASSSALRLLFVSHYNYYRNFETLLRAIPLLGRLLPDRKVTLFLTCKLSSGENPGSYRAETASSLAEKLRGAGSVVELGAVPYSLLHRLYKACHIYVTPAYAETFAHPLVEAMSSGLPVVASDLPVHREICGEGALYFSRFSPEELAGRVAQIAGSPQVAGALSEAGLDRSREFRWDRHVESLVDLAAELIARRNSAR